MFRTTKIVLVAVALCGLTSITLADTITYGDPTSWNILNENYGNGSGQVSVLDSYEVKWSTDPTETLSDGLSTLTLGTGTATKYQVKTTISGMVTGNADYTMEFKLRFPSDTCGLLQWSETNSTTTAHWSHSFFFNRLYTGGATPNALQDYNLKSAVNQAPAGFDGSLAHIYRFVRVSGVEKLYLDNDTTPLLTLLNGAAGSAADKVNMTWGFYQSSTVNATVEMSYLKMTSGAYVPTATPEPSSIVLLAAAAVGFVAYGWRKRK